MNWTVTWFIVNIVFVVAIIAYLFMQRSYTEAKQQQADADIIKRLDQRRKLMGTVSIVFFVAMVGSFIANMYFNG